MAYTENQKVSIRIYLGASSIFLQLFPKLENSIISSQSIADGGVQVDSSLETRILGLIDELDAIEVKITNLYCQVQVVEANKKEIVLDTSRGLYLLRQEGRRKIGILSRSLGCLPLYDYFSGQPSSNDDFANIGSMI